MQTKNAAQNIHITTCNMHKSGILYIVQFLNDSAVVSIESNYRFCSMFEFPNWKFKLSTQMCANEYTSAYRSLELHAGNGNSKTKPFSIWLDTFQW